MAEVAKERGIDRALFQDIRRYFPTPVVQILQRDTLAPVGTFGSGGRYPGQFVAVGSIAVDAQGAVYTGEQHHGKRVQKFVQR